MLGQNKFLFLCLVDDSLILVEVGNPVDLSISFVDIAKMPVILAHKKKFFFEDGKPSNGAYHSFNLIFGIVDYGFEGKGRNNEDEYSDVFHKLIMNLFY